MSAFKGARTDLIIATVALLVSAGATVSSVYQTHVVADQLSASVWPYLSIETDLSNGSFSLSMTNDGLGPALVRSATLYVDGRPMPTYRKAIGAIIRGPYPSTGFKGGFGSVDSTTVIRVGDRRALISGTAANIKKFGDLGKRVSLELCYCSYLEQCWEVRSAGHASRRRVASCRPNDGIDY